MKKRKPELISVKMIAWFPRHGIYGLETLFDDGICYVERWGSYHDTFRMMEIRSKDIRASLLRERK